jgi:hypothetical protein
MKFTKLLFFGAIVTFGLLTTSSQNPLPAVSQSQMSPTTRNPQDYIGFQYEIDQQPKGVEILGSSVLFGGGAVKNRLGGYAYVRQGGQNMLWLTGQKKQEPQSKPIWEVLDVLAFPKYDRQLNNRTYHLGWGGRCRTRNGLSNANLVAIVVLEKKEWLGTVKQAWMMNRKTGKFESASAANIVCENPHLF